MAKDGSDEIDTILETTEGKAAANPMEQLKSVSADILLSNGLDSSKAEVNESAAFPEQTFYFSDFPRKVYCTVSGIRVRLIQTGEGTGIAYLTFTQTCGSQRSTVASGADWTFNVALRDAQNANIRSIYLGTWNHRCGKHLVELRADFSWVSGAINPVINARSATINWTHLQRVKNCG